jgi:hypothetical protein
MAFCTIKVFSYPRNGNDTREKLFMTRRYVFLLYCWLTPAHRLDIQLTAALVIRLHLLSALNTANRFQNVAVCQREV